MEVSVGLLENARGDSLVLIRDTSLRRRELIANRQLQRQSDFLVELFKQADSFDESAIVRRVIGRPAHERTLACPQEEVVARRDQWSRTVVLASGDPEVPGCVETW